MIKKKIVKPIGILDKYVNVIQSIETLRHLGSVAEINGRIIYSKGPDVKLGEICQIEHLGENKFMPAEVIGFRDGYVILSPFHSIEGIFPGSRVISTGLEPTVTVNHDILGRVYNGLGQPLDDGEPMVVGEKVPLKQQPPNPLHRPLIDTALPVGVKAIDGLLTIGKGQRVGIFAGSGVGKSSLLGMIARNSTADINVIGMIGERGREVAEFISRDLGEFGMKKSILVVASSNESPAHRVRAAYMVTAISEYFRDQGLDVLLMMDSLTRLSLAQREVGLAAGEPATTRGFPPSVFTLMPELLERAGTSSKGSITGIYTVLVEGDDLNEPISDSARGILDGHIVLSRKLAERGIFPAISVQESISRVMNEVVEDGHRQNAQHIKELIAAYRENEDLIQLGAYASGTNPVLDQAITKMPEIMKILKQDRKEAQRFTETISQIENLAGIPAQADLRRVV